MCQIMTKKVFYILWMPFLLAIGGCSEDPASEPALLPDRLSPYALFPNDVAANDSASAYVANGLQYLVHPKASYTLSFDKDASIKKNPTLHLFRLGSELDDGRISTGHVRALEGREENGRLVYDFVCEESERSVWISSLVLDGEIYKGTTHHVKLTADGPYSDTLSINLIVVGKIDFKEPDMNVELFAQKLLEGFRKYYTSIVIDTLYVRYAHEHPTLGSKYPADQLWLAGRTSSDYFVSDLGGWPEPGLKNALDIVLVHRIELDYVLGYSMMYSGNLYDGKGSTVVIGAYSKNSSGENGLTSSSIISTALHETGHFLGLRHTTTTQADYEATLDFSNYEDGFTDTPYCSELQQSGLLKRHDEGPVVDFELPLFRGVFASSNQAFDMNGCPDFRNIMFPAVNDERMEGFSAQQLAHIRKNLRVFPH